MHYYPEDVNGLTEISFWRHRVIPEAGRSSDKEANCISDAHHEISELVSDMIPFLETKWRILWIWPHSNLFCEIIVKLMIIVHAC